MPRTTVLKVGTTQQPPDGVTVPTVFTDGPNIGIWLESVKKLDETGAEITGMTIERDTDNVHYVVAHLKWD
jgi:hypothetical protein